MHGGTAQHLHMEDNSPSPGGAASGTTGDITYMNNTNCSSIVGVGMKNNNGGNFNNTQPLNNISAIYMQ